MEQRSKEWHEMRRGRFTASKISDLLGAKGLGKTGETYAFKVAREVVFGVDPEEEIETYDIKRGIELEPLAFDKFAELMSLEFKTVEKCLFFPYGTDAGASPDGIVGSDENLEIKCPKPDKFFRLVAEGASAIDSDYYDQMQMQMLCNNSVRTYFFNFIIFKNRPLWHTIMIDRDEARIELIKKRIKEAAHVRDGYIKMLKQNAQFEWDEK